MDLREDVEDAGTTVVPGELDLRKRFLVDERVHFGRGKNFLDSEKLLLYQFIPLGCGCRRREVAGQGQLAHLEKFFSAGVEKQIAAKLGALEEKTREG